MVVDEVSMVGCAMLRDIHVRLCAIMDSRTRPFGGMCIVVMGDFASGLPILSLRGVDLPRTTTSLFGALFRRHCIQNCGSK